jgi:hypothetical protein
MKLKELFTILEIDMEQEIYDFDISQIKPHVERYVFSSDLESAAEKMPSVEVRFKYLKLTAV